MTAGSQNEKKIVKLQSVIRGFLLRKAYTAKSGMILSSRSKQMHPGGNLFLKYAKHANLRKVNDMPKNTNLEVSKTEAKLGPFDFNNANQKEELANLKDKGPY